MYTTERLHFHFSLSRIGEGNGNPLQCFCLENPRDGVAQSQSRTRRKLLSSSSSSPFLCSLKETSFQTLVRCFSRTLAHHLLGILAWWTKSLFHAPTPGSWFTGLSCGKENELGAGSFPCAAFPWGGLLHTANQLGFYGCTIHSLKTCLTGETITLLTERTLHGWTLFLSSPLNLPTGWTFILSWIESLCVLVAQSYLTPCDPTTLWIVTCQTTLSLEFFWQEYWTGVLFPSPGVGCLPGIVKQFSRPMVSNSLQPHALQHTRLPCPSPIPKACWNSSPSPHPLSSPSPTFNLSQHQGLFQWVSSSSRWPKFWSFSCSISPSVRESTLIETPHPGQAP